MSQTNTITNLVKVRCLEDSPQDNLTFHFLEEHLRVVHNMTLEEYIAKHGADVPVVSNPLWEAYLKDSANIKRKGTSRFDGILKVGKISIERSEGDVYYTFPRPAHYEYPKEGSVAQRVERVARAFKYRRHLFIYGPAGAGKSAVVRALCHDLNLEASHYPMRDGLDSELYIGQMEVVIDEETGNNITQFTKGKLLQDLEGRIGTDGVRRGVVILMDDIDRAPAEYHEILRHALEDNARNIFVPELGINIELHPDTMIVATANSAGRGDTTGMYSSVQEMDESILDRFQRVVQFEFMPQEQERRILQKKFPLVAQTAGDKAFNPIMQSATMLRNMVESGAIFASFSHRRLVQWCMSLEELITENDNKFEHEMLKESAQDWMEWMDETTRAAVVDRALSTTLGR